MTRNRIFSASMLLLCLIMFLATYTFADAGSTVGRVAGPATFPRWVIAITAVFATVNLVASFISKQERKEKSTGRFDASAFISRYRSPLILSALFFAYVLALTLLGFVASTLAFLFLSQLLLRGIKTKRDIITNLAITLVGTFAVYFVFTEMLTIILP